MSQFPALKTGAVMQYPAARSAIYSTSISRFVDGKEQRGRDALRLRRWSVQLTQLDEGELAAIDLFFTSQHGSGDAFAFTDPWDGTVYPSCRLEQDELKQTWNAPGDGRTQLTILENRI